MKVAVMVSGSGTNLEAILKAVEDGTIKNVQVELVISNKPDVYALERAKKRNIKTAVIKPKDFSTREEYGEFLNKTLDENNIELAVLAGFLVILPMCFTSHFKNRIINIHPSLIPAHCGPGYYGLKVHESVLAKGNKVTGATVHFVNEEADAGPIIAQKAVTVMEDDTPEVLQKRVMEQAEWLILPQAIDDFANGRLEVEGNIVRHK